MLKQTQNQAYKKTAIKSIKKAQHMMTFDFAWGM